MELKNWFWVFYVLALILWGWMEYVPGQPYPVRRLPGGLLFFVLIGLLGWQVFGSAVK
jgi:hypothetical protein